MNFKYYDLLSNLILGIVVFYFLWRLVAPEIEINEWMVIPAGFVTGYFLDALSSLIERLLFKTISGKPSDRLLAEPNEEGWTGINKVRFYYADKAKRLLKEDVENSDATVEQLFGHAIQEVDSKVESRVPDFKSHYAFSRVVLTTAILAFIIVEVYYYDVWYSWPISIAILLLAWVRFKHRGYYYAREVLIEYLKGKN